MNQMADWLKEIIPDLYVLNCEVGDGYNSTIFETMWDSVVDMQKCISDDPQMKDGFIGIGFSQGGYIMRSYLENHTAEMPQMKRFISICSPHAGYFCGRDSVCGQLPQLPEILNNLIIRIISLSVNSILLC